MDSPVCRGCGEAITGEYLTALGATWHPEHFRCTACGLALREQFLVDPVGLPYCTDRPSTHPTCRFCDRLIIGRTGDDDNRCPTCMSRAVAAATDAQSRFVQVVRWAAFQGMTYPRRIRIHVELADAAQLTRDKDDGDDRAPLGKAYTRVTTRDGQPDEGEVDKILLERGLPTPLFEGVAVHELGHAWLAIQGVYGLPKWAEEGFCELLAHRWYEDAGTPESRSQAERIERNTSPVYGEGFRQLDALARAVDFRELIAALRATKALPPRPP